MVLRANGPFFSRTLLDGSVDLGVFRDWLDPGSDEPGADVQEC